MVITCKYLNMFAKEVLISFATESDSESDDGAASGAFSYMKNRQEQWNTKRGGKSSPSKMCVSVNIGKGSGTLFCHVKVSFELYVSRANLFQMLGRIHLEVIVRLTMEKFSVRSKTGNFSPLPHLKEILRRDMFVFKLPRQLYLTTVFIRIKAQLL